MRNKRGQQAVGMSFGMIFAIFLIIVFVVIAFIAIKSVVGTGDAAKIGLFYKDLQDDVDSALRGQMSDSKFVIDLPSGIEKICFGNLSARITNEGADYLAIKDYEVYDANLFLVPPEKAQNMQWKELDKINVTRITEGSNPYCVSVDVDLKIRKEFYDRLVWIE